MKYLWELPLAPCFSPTGQRPKGSGGEHVSRVIHGNLCLKDKVRAKHAGCFYCEHELP